MYFTIGWIRSFRASQSKQNGISHNETSSLFSVQNETQGNDVIQGIAFNPTVHPLLCVITGNCISIWTAKHDGFHLETSHHVSCGLGKNVMWKSALYVAVQSQDCSQIIIFRLLVRINGKVTTYHVLMKSQIQEGEEISYELEEIAVCKSNEGKITCMCSDDKHILLGTNFGYILVALWETGEVLQVISPDFIPKIATNISKKTSPGDEDGEVEIEQLTYSRGLNLYAMVLSNGSLIFMSSSQSQHSHLHQSHLSQSQQQEEQQQGLLDESFQQSYGKNPFMNQQQQHKKHGHHQQSYINFNIEYFEPSINASAVALHSRYSLAAVGCSNGQVLLYEISNHSQQKKFLKRSSVTLSLENRGYTSEELGRVTLLHFSGDGNAVCVGYSKRGLAVFHLSGVCIMSTLPRYVETIRRQNLKNSNIEQNTSCSDYETGDGADQVFFARGVKSMTWDIEGYHLVAAAQNSMNFHVFTFYKSTLSRNPSQNKYPFITLQGCDRLLLFHNINNKTIEASTASSADWEQLQIPNAYLQQNYPCKYVSMSPDGQQIAVAGKKGFCIYNRVLRKWRLFGDINQEMELKSDGIEWIDNVVVAFINRRNAYNEMNEVLLYPRFHLDKQSLVGSALITKARVLHISCCSAGNIASQYHWNDQTHSPSKKKDSEMNHERKDSNSGIHLYIYDANHILHIFNIQLNYLVGDYSKSSVSIGGAKTVKATVQKVRSVSFQSQHVMYPICMTSVHTGSLHPDTQKKSLNDAQASQTSDKILILHADRTLSVFDVTQNKEYPLVDDYKTDQFWIETETPERLLYFLYSQEAGGVRCCLDDINYSQKKVLQKFISYDPDSCPLGIVKETGIFLHGSLQATSSAIQALQNQNTPTATGSGFRTTYFEIQPKLYPYYHGILLTALLCELDRQREINPSQQYDNDAVIHHLYNFIKSNLMGKVTINASLEWLLHSVLSGDCLVQLNPSPTRSTSASHPSSSNLSSSNPSSSITKNTEHLNSPKLAGRPSSPVFIKKLEPDNMSSCHEMENELEKILCIVVKLLKKFPSFYEIVISVLRKSDFFFWDRLFKQLSPLNPRKMFEQCISHGLIHESVNMLRILQQTEGLEFTRQCAYSLLQPALQNHHFELGRDLIRFINMLELEGKHHPGITTGNTPSEKETSEKEISEKETSEKETITKQVVQSENLENTEIYIPGHPSLPQEVSEKWLQGNVKLQTVIIKQARKELQVSNLFALYQIVECFNLPLEQFLKKEKEKSAKLDPSKFSAAFAAIHQSFDLPRSSFERINPHVLHWLDNRFHSTFTTHPQSHPVREKLSKNQQYFTYTQDRLIYPSTFQLEHIHYLFKSFTESNCYGYSLLLAIILCDVEYLKETLKSNGELVPPIMEILKEDYHKYVSYFLHSFSAHQLTPMKVLDMKSSPII